jgi:RND family efflux transporter MFP subunit
MRRGREVASALVVVISVAALAGCKPAIQSDPRVETKLVRAATAAPVGKFERSFTGVVVARVESNLGFRVPGKVVERLVDAGQTVKKGQPLLRMDPADLSLTNRAGDELVAAAKSKAVQTAADEKRYRELVSAGAVSASAYDQAKAAAEAAQAQLNAAVAQASLTRNSAGYSELLADANGVVMETLAEPGQVVAAGQTVVRLARSGPREASIDLPETLRPAIGSVAQAALYGGEGVNARARLRQLSAFANPATRTFEARYVLEGAAASAPLGSTVTIRLATASGTPGVTVPLSALYDPKGTGAGVWVLDGEPLKVTWRAVKVGGLSDETASVTSGLNPGDRFVALGAHLLHEGESVRLADASKGAKQ